MRPLRGALFGLAIAGALAGAPDLRPGVPAAAAATKLFIRNHANSNDVRGVAPWDGRLAAATTGGLVTVSMPNGPFAKTLRSPDGLPSNQTLCLTASPANLLWVGTADAGLARLRTDGAFRRTLTTFDGLPSNRVQALHRTGDSIWVGTSGGVALFTEAPLNGQIALRRSDSNASTAGALISDDVRALAVHRDTLWCATGAGLAAFAAGAWIDRTDLLAAAANALLAVGDTLWVGTAAGPRAYVGGVLEPVASGHFGQCLALARAAGAVYSATSGVGVFRFAGGAWAATGAGIPSAPARALGVAPDGALWTGTDAGLARYAAGTDAWTLHRTDGPLVDAMVRAAADARGVWFVTGNASAAGTGGGVVVHYDGAEWSALTTANTGGSLQAASTFGLLSDRNGRLWFGHCCAGGGNPPRTDRWDPSTDTWDRPAATNLITFGLGPPGRVFGGGVEFGNGVYVFDEPTAALVDSLTPLNTQGSARGAGLTENQLRAIAFDGLGRGWFALATNGLDRWEGHGTDAHADDEWDHFGGGFPSLQTTSLAVLSDSVVYVGTASGIAPLRNGFMDTFLRNAVNALIGGGAVTALAADPRGVVWMATDAGLIRLDHGTGSLERFTAADGLVSDDLRALAWDEGRGTLWVGASPGVSEVRPVAEGTPAFDAGTYVFPNPIAPSSGPLRIGGLTGAAEGEVRDATGALIVRFRVDPISNVAWDLRAAGGGAAASGIYLIVLRDGPRTRILRAAVVR